MGDAVKIAAMTADEVAAALRENGIAVQNTSDTSLESMRAALLASLNGQGKDAKETFALLCVRS